MGDTKTQIEVTCEHRTARRVVHRLRWWICRLLFASTMINYIDRQSLAALTPHLKIRFQWRNQDFAWALIAFRIANACGKSVMGGLIDRLAGEVSTLVSSRP